MWEFKVQSCDLIFHVFLVLLDKFSFRKVSNHVLPTQNLIMNPIIRPNPTGNNESLNTDQADPSTQLYSKLLYI